MPSSPPHSPKDVADVLEAIARRLRSDPAFALEMARRMGHAERVTVARPADLHLVEELEPEFGEVDVLLSEDHITVTAQVRNVDQTMVHVSVLDRQLILSIGEGPDEKRQDVMLPAEVDEEHAVATFRNGVLDVVLPLRFILG